MAAVLGGGGGGEGGGGEAAAGFIFPIYLYRKLKKSCLKPQDRFLNNTAEMILW